MQERQRVVDFELTHWRRDRPGYAFTFADQDVFNAILATRIGPERVVALDQRLAARAPVHRPAAGRRAHPAAPTRTPPRRIWSIITVKPWLEPRPTGVYSRLLRRLLIGDDLAVAVPADEVRRGCEPGPRAHADRKRTNVRERFRWHVREPLAATEGQGTLSAAFYRRRLALLPRRGRARQLAAPGRPPRADPPARLRPRRRAAAARSRR